MPLKLISCAILALSLMGQPVKRIPADGIAIPAADRAELQAGLAHLQASIARLKPGPLLPDVLIYSEAVRFSLEPQGLLGYGQPSESPRRLLDGLQQRLAALALAHGALRRSPLSQSTAQSHNMT